MTNMSEIKIYKTSEEAIKTLYEQGVRVLTEGIIVELENMLIDINLLMLKDMEKDLKKLKVLHWVRPFKDYQERKELKILINRCRHAQNKILELQQKVSKVDARHKSIGREKDEKSDN